MPNIFGLVDEGGLTNPLSEDLLADGFNALDFNEVHLNELHDNSGTGKIVVHEEFNMTNNKISNLADPIASKDAVTLEYFNNNQLTRIYDVAGAMTDETTPIQVGGQIGSFNVPREFKCDKIVCYLRTGATAASYAPTIYINGNAVNFSQDPIFVNAGDTISQDGYFQSGPTTILAGSIIQSAANTDATAAGLKVALIGEIPLP
jgi:hypothetical protein